MLRPATRQVDCHPDGAEFPAALLGRRILLDGIRALGLGVAREPEGAYYLLADASRVSADSFGLARRILEEAHVGVCPGVDFGSRAEGMLRFSYASSAEDLREGLRRLASFLRVL